MKITFKVNTAEPGEQPKYEKKEYFVGELSMLVVRKSMEIQQLIEAKELDLLKIRPDQLDMIVDFIIAAFNYQFTRDEFYNYYSPKGFVINTMKVVNDIQSQLVKELEASPE